MFAIVLVFLWLSLKVYLCVLKFAFIRMCACILYISLCVSYSCGERILISYLCDDQNLSLCREEMKRVSDGNNIDAIIKSCYRVEGFKGPNPKSSRISGTPSKKIGIPSDLMVSHRKRWYVVPPRYFKVLQYISRLFPLNKKYLKRQQFVHFLFVCVFVNFFKMYL